MAKISLKPGPSFGYIILIEMATARLNGPGPVQLTEFCVRTGPHGPVQTLNGPLASQTGLDKFDSLDTRLLLLSSKYMESVQHELK